MAPAASGASSGSVSQLQVTLDSSTAGATFTTLTVSFTATDGIPRENRAGSTYPGFVTLTGPTGMAFSGFPTGDYVIRDGAQEIHTGVDQENAGTNVVQIDIPDGLSVASGDRVEVIAHGVNNPGSPDAAGQLAISTSADPDVVSSPLPITAPPSLNVTGGGCRLGLTGVSARTTRGGGAFPFVFVRGSVTCTATHRGAVVMATDENYIPSVWGFISRTSSPSLTLRAHHTLNFRLRGSPCRPGRRGHWRVGVGLKLRRHGERPLVLMTPLDYVTLDCVGNGGF